MRFGPIPISPAAILVSLKTKQYPQRLWPIKYRPMAPRWNLDCSVVKLQRVLGRTFLSKIRAKRQQGPFKLMATSDSIIPICVSDEPSSLSALRKCSSFSALLGALLVVANFAIVRSLRLDPDTWWHIKVGQRILDTGQWPSSDIYSFTAHGVLSMAYEWLGEILFALAWRVGGLRGIDLLLLGLTSTFLVLLYSYAYMRSNNMKAAFVAVLVTLPLAEMCFTLRPQMLGYICLLVMLMFLERFRQGRQKALWALPPLFLVWVNTHGSFALGLFLLGVYWASGWVGWSAGGLRAEPWTAGQRRHLGLIFLLCLVAICFTPYGTRLAAYPIDMAFLQPVNVANIQEWQPLNFGFLQGKLLLFIVFAIVVIQIIFRLRYRLEELALFLFATYAACIHSRFIILFAIVATPLLASLLAQWIPAYRRSVDKYVLNALLIAAAILGMGRYFPSQAKLQHNVSEEYPVEAVEYLQHHPVAEPMFNAYPFGGYLVWATGPAHKVFIDGRGDLYEHTGTFADYLQIDGLKPNALALLQKYRIQSCLIGRDTPLATLLSAVPGWQQVYTDKVAVVFVRNEKSVANISASGK